MLPLELATMIYNYFPSWFRARMGGAWPLNYCCIDVETSGYRFDRDVITQWGHCLVQDGKVVDKLSLIVDWSNHAIVQDHWLRIQLNAVRQGMELAGKKCHVSYERMCKEGMKPEKALRFIHEFTQTIKKKGVIFVAHGGIFDEKMLCANMLGHEISDGFSFGDDGWVDTESTEKAGQLLDNSRCHPKQGDTLRSYWHRVKYTRADRVKSNLDEHCFIKYKLDKHGVTPKDLHDAGTDAWCCHLLMEEFRSMILPEGAQPPVYPFADHQVLRKGSSGAAPPVRVGPTHRVRGQRNS